MSVHQAGIEVSSEPRLELRDVVVRFGGVRAVDGVSLRVDPGEVRGLIGPNGAGKTTLFDVVAGARRPTSGSVLIAGHDVTERSSTWRARRGVRRTFQRQQLFGWLSVRDNVLSALESEGGGGGVAADLFGLPSRRRRTRRRMIAVDELLDRCGLADLGDVPAGMLSIGTARLVELARALVARPQLLLLDEPTSGLEDADTERLGAVVAEYVGQSGCAVLLVEHDIGFVMRFCDRVTVLSLGSVIADDTAEAVRAHPDVRSAYIGSSPPTTTTNSPITTSDIGVHEGEPRADP